MYHAKALSIMKKVAHHYGFSVRLNARGDLKLYKKKIFKGVIVVIDSEYDNAPCPIASRHVGDSVEYVREAMIEALVKAKILSWAETNLILTKEGG